MSFFKGRKLKKVALENSIDFDARMGLSINGNLVHDFGYLLKHYTTNNLESFDDRSAISKIKDKTIDAINLDLQNPKTQEELTFGVSRATAEGNLRNLIKILESLSNYHAAEVA
ncbi:hypothetical protein CXF80_19020 [Shewanella sp. Actino-trap-3]|uniref:hypothetical protein n=1 Tax=Shewanella sp. Actino-trap-3 TaxID=2058331 RepID=UPI000C33D67F|nr:hypothetical protein [Shewanella sp. Actino-trap-3]PKG80220.1 hypothetical protein CXF80_19020 [Shewanella sp. Actino-trap-3]